MCPAPAWVQPMSAGVKQLPPLTTSPRWAPGPIPAEAEQKKGPLIAGGGLGSEGCYSSALRCAPMGHRALRAGASVFPGWGCARPFWPQRAGGAPTGDRSSLRALGPVPSRGSSKTICCTAAERRERWETCPELISRLPHAGATSVGRGFQGALGARSSPVSVLGCILLVIPPCSTVGPGVHLCVPQLMLNCVPWWSS